MDNPDDARIIRREFFKAAGVSTAILGAAGAASSRADGLPSPPADALVETKYPKLSMITRYSPQKLAFAASAGYEGVVIPLDDFFDPDRLKDSQIDEILGTARQAGVRIISIECMWRMDHIAQDSNRRKVARERFMRCLEFGHRLGCKFVGMFSGGGGNAPVGDKVKGLAEALNDQYLPLCEKLDLSIGPENYPCPENFATVPATWEKIFALVPNQRFGLEFDPSHLVRQFIDPIATAWAFKDRIRAVHLKDTEITQAVLQKTGIHGDGWWRYRIPGQGLMNWPAFFTVLLQIGFKGGVAVEHEDDFWDEPGGNDKADFPQSRKDGFILAERFLRQYLPGRLS